MTTFKQLARAGWGLEDIAAERTLMPHPIMRRVVLEQVNTASAPDFDGWLKHAEEALP